MNLPPRSHRGRFALLLALAGVFISSGASAGYKPIVVPVAGLPATLQGVFVGSPDLFGTADGLYVRVPGTNRWTHHLRNRQVLVSGRSGDGWWAAGEGFVALSDGRIISCDEIFYAGIENEGELLLANNKGAWRLGTNGLELIHPVEERYRMHLCRTEEGLFLFGSNSAAKWTGKGFSSEASPYRPIAGGIHSFERDGVRYWAFSSLLDLRNPGFSAEAVRGSVFVADSGKQPAVIANVHYGMTCLRPTGEPIWKLTIEDLKGSPYSGFASSEGYYLGTNNGALLLLADWLQFSPIIGSKIASVHHDIAYPWAAHGRIHLAAGEVEPSLISAAADGIEGTLEHVLIDGQRVRLPGRYVTFASKFGDGWAVVYETGVSIISKAGAVVRSYPQTALGTAAAESEQVLWVAAQNKLLRLEGDTMIEVEVDAPTWVANAATGVAFIGESSLRFHSPRATPVEFPGRIIALHGRFLVLETESGNFVGRYTEEGDWQPLNIPTLASERVLGLVDRGEFLYLVTATRLLRAETERIPELPPLPPLTQRTFTTDENTLTVNLPPNFIEPWPQFHRTVLVDDHPVPTIDDTVTVPRLPYGNTTLTLRSEFGGRTQVEDIVITRLRPWWIDWRGISLYSLAGLAGLFGAVRWRTKRLQRRAEHLAGLVAARTRELNDALRSREFFFSSLNHEIRNPLNGVIGLCDVLADRASVTERDRFIISALKDCSDHLNRLLSDAIDIAQIDRGQLPLQEEIFELSATVLAAARTMDPTMRRTELVPPAKTWLRGDAGKIRQIVANLISNAHKYGRPSHAVVNVAASAESPHILVTIAVRNRGNPIPPEERELIFTGFARGRHARASGERGSGLGLAYSQRLAHALGGELTLTSDATTTEFVFAASFAPATAPVTIADGAPAAPLSSRHVLAVEDEAYNRLVMGNLLERLGCTVDWAVDATSAFDAATTSDARYDLIFTDYRLGGDTGIDFAVRLRRHLGTACPPIVLVTAYSSPEKRIEAHAAGISRFVTKPVNLTKLTEALGLAPDTPSAESNPGLEAPDFTAFLLPSAASALKTFADSLDDDIDQLAAEKNRAQLAARAHRIAGKIALTKHRATADLLIALEDAARKPECDVAAPRVAAIQALRELSQQARARIGTTP